MRIASALALLLLALCLTAQATGASADLLWDNGPFDDGYAIGNGKGTETMFGKVDLQTADDFEVPEPGWLVYDAHIEGLCFFGNLQVDYITVAFFSDGGDTLPEEDPIYIEESYDFTVSDYYDPDWGYYHVDIDVKFGPVGLEPGVYWVYVQPYGLAGDWHYQGCTAQHWGSDSAQRDSYWWYGWMHYAPGYDISFKLAGETLEPVYPEAVIDLPVGDVVIYKGDCVEFAGTATDENGEVVDWLWTFGEGSGIDDMHTEDPGSVQFNNPGVFVVTFNAQDNDGNWDPTPDQRMVIVNEGPWWLMNPPDPPHARGYHAMAYDAESDLVILFGGYIAENQRADDTWAYDYNTDTWTELFPEVSPSARITHSMAYDAESDRIILFGGIQDGDDKMGDTWTYDYNTNTWEEMDPATHPDDRYGFAFAYDAESDLVVLHGGRGQPYVNLDDTWWYDYNTNTWHGPFYPNPRPSPPRRNLPMAYDAESDRCILFGGENDAGQPEPGTWAYDQNTNTWDDRQPPNPPEDRMLHAMAYHAGIDRVILFGGGGWTGLDDDTWAYDYNSNTWEEIAADIHPTARICYQNMTYDAESGLIILFGGDEGHETFMDDTWAFTATAFYAPEDWLWPGWNWIALPVVPCGGEPTATLRFDCGGRLWYWDKYGKWGQVYQPPFVTFDMIVGESYLLWLDDVPEPISYLGSPPEMPFEHKMGRMGWTWLGKPGTEELGGDAFMDTVLVKYPSDEMGELRTAREDWQSGEPWLNWGWSWWDAYEQTPRTFTPYLPWYNVCYPWVGYRCWVQVGTAQCADDPDQVTLIWPRTGG